MLCPAFWLRTCYCFVILFLGLVAGSAQVFLASTNEITDQLTLEMRIPKSLSRAEEQALKPKDLFKECDNCPEMIVPAGEFMMGSPEDEEGHTEDESPQHKVQLLTPFAVGRFAVTFEEWDACVADHGCRKYMPPDRGWGRGRRPVIAIWWDDAIAYVRWVSQKTGRNYRLLSEAEREYVARAGTTTPFWWGNSIFSNRANYASSRGGEVQRKTLPVDSFEPNPWGLYQVHGNVSEWIGDCWHYDYEGAPLDGTAWTSIDCERPMLRGGNWNSTPWELRSASRGRWASAALFLPAIGMRVARPLR